MLARALVAALLLALGAAPALAAAPCPDNQFYPYSGGLVNSTLPSDQRDDGASALDYDIPNAHLSASVSVDAEGYGYATVNVLDDFHVFGLAPGTPLSIVAHLVGAGTSATASLRDALGGSATATFDDATPDADLTLAVDVTGGQTFRLTYSLSASGGQLLGVGGSATATFSFTGLPPGTAVVSCNGYVSDKSVPVRAMTWSKLKSHYR